MPGWPRWLECAAIWRRARSLTALDLGCRGLAVAWPAIDGPSCAAAQAAGLEVAAFTVTERADYRRLVGLGVTAICVEGEALTG